MQISIDRATPALYKGNMKSALYTANNLNLGLLSLGALLLDRYK